MRRWMVLFVGLAVTVTIGWPAVADASPGRAPAHVKPGAKWSLTDGNGCLELQTFKKGHRWTADNGDMGTYTGGGATIKETWTHGPFTSFTGTYSKSTRAYSGILVGPVNVLAQLAKGTVSGC
ncbi:MAG TPA: hypothetical protein VK277_16080 [Acidimicrobiales bacterium]|nr:hypothetical protein [Acidimicrobiales bacterium]